MITNEQIYEAANAHAKHPIKNKCTIISDTVEMHELYLRKAFITGAEWALEQQQNDLYNALKGLGLDKHAIALNVLKIAGIEFPKH